MTAKSSGVEQSGALDTFLAEVKGMIIHVYRNGVKGQCYSSSQVKKIEKRDAVLTSSQQIDRLLRPGSTYFNLNPFEVWQLCM